MGKLIVIIYFLLMNLLNFELVVSVGFGLMLLLNLSFEWRICRYRYIKLIINIILIMKGIYIDPLQTVIVILVLSLSIAYEIYRVLNTPNHGSSNQIALNNGELNQIDMLNQKITKNNKNLKNIAG